MTSRAGNNTAVQQVFRKWDLIDCKDSLGFWCVGQVVDVDNRRNQIRVHYMRWSNSWDEWVDVPSSGIAPLSTHRIELNHPGIQKILAIAQQYQRHKNFKNKPVGSKKRSHPTPDIEENVTENPTESEPNNGAGNLNNDNNFFSINRSTVLHKITSLKEFEQKMYEEVDETLKMYGHEFNHNQYSWLFHLCDVYCSKLILKYWKKNFIPYDIFNESVDNTEMIERKEIIGTILKSFYIECRTLDSKREHLLLNVFFTIAPVDEVIDIIISLVKDNEVRLRHRWVFALADLGLLTPERADYILAQTPLRRSCQLFSTQKFRSEQLQNQQLSIAYTTQHIHTFVSSPISMENFVGFWCNYFEILASHGAQLPTLLNLFNDDYVQEFTTSTIRQRWCKKFLSGTNTYKFLHDYPSELREKELIPQYDIVIPNDVWSVIDDMLKSIIICPFE